MNEVDPFESPDRPVASGGDLVVDLEGYEGPIDVLLALARQQKVDLLHISILQPFKNEIFKFLGIYYGK